jgi:hypothetical protein
MPTGHPVIAPLLCPETDDPERIYAYTVWSKNRFFGNKVQVNVPPFTMTTKTRWRSSEGLQILIITGLLTWVTVTNGQLRKYGVD